MKGDYEPDQFTESDVLQCLDRAGLKHKQGHRYILSQCPTHEDSHPSVQIYKNDWFVNCHAGCGRYHITKAFPELRQNYNVQQPQRTRKFFPRTMDRESKKVIEHNYIKQDQMKHWESLPLIPRDHYFKNIPLDVLDGLGWRWEEKKNSYFIPYFSRSKTSIPFSQLRHLSGERRFTFLKDAKPTCYGTWNLEPGITLFVVEGTSDCAVLEHCCVPWIGLPSASSGELLKQMAKWCKENRVKLIYAGDNDEAGDKLREALDTVMSYRVKQPRFPYKDWGDMYEAEGQESVINYCNEELLGAPMSLPKQKTPVEKVLDIFGGGVVLEVVDGGKKQLETPTSPLGI